MTEALLIRLLKRLAAAGPVSLIDVDDIECSCVLLAARLVHADAPFAMRHRPGTAIKPMTVWVLTPAGVNLVLSKTALRMTRPRVHEVPVTCAMQRSSSQA